MNVEVFMVDWNKLNKDNHQNMKNHWYSPTKQHIFTDSTTTEIITNYTSWSRQLIIQLKCLADFQWCLLIFSQWTCCWWRGCACLTPGSLCHYPVTCQPCFCSIAFWIVFLLPRGCEFAWLSSGGDDFCLAFGMSWHLSSGMLAGLLSKGLWWRRFQHLRPCWIMGGGKRCTPWRWMANTSGFFNHFVPHHFVHSELKTEVYYPFCSVQKGFVILFSVEWCNSTNAGWKDLRGERLAELLNKHWTASVGPHHLKAASPALTCSVWLFSQKYWSIFIHLFLPKSTHVESAVTVVCTEGQTATAGKLQFILNVQKFSTIFSKCWILHFVFDKLALAMWLQRSLLSVGHLKHI